VIFVVGAGRLGNQLFQLANALRIRKPRELVLSLGLGRALELVRHKQAIINCDSEWVYRIYDVILRRILGLLGSMRAISRLTEEAITPRKGALPLVHVFGYFQSEKFVPDSITDKLRTKRIATIAEDIVRSEAGGRTPYFLHVRHGDYRGDNWVLPLSYYLRAIDLAREAYGLENIHFFILGDDPDWETSMFSFLPYKTISRENLYIDLMIMAACGGGIISNSTFSWWGGYLCRCEYPVFAPKYGANWIRKGWQQKDMPCKKFMFLEIDD
jgi:hypothetical protein